MRFWLSVLLVLVIPSTFWGVGCSDEAQVSTNERTAGECADGRDNDQDGKIDCADSGCQLYIFCTLSTSSSETDSDLDVDTDTDTDTDSDTDIKPDTNEDTDTNAVEKPLKIQGIVKLEGISSRISASGTLCMMVARGCPQTGSAPRAFREAAFSRPDSQFPNRQTEVAFTIETPKDYLEEGSQYWVAAFVQDSGGECSQNGPSGGDAMTFTLVMGPPLVGCDKFTVSNGQDVTGLRVKMNFQNQMGFIPWLN